MDTTGYAAIERLARRQDGLITTAQLRDLRVSKSAVRHLHASGRLHPVRYGVHSLPGVTVDGRAELRSAVWSSGGCASHRSAAALSALPGFDFGVPETTTVGRSPSPRGIRVHVTNLLPARHQRSVDGIPVTSIARTLLDLTAVVSPRRAERAVDNALARRMVTLPALHRVLDDCSARGRRKLATFRELMEQRSTGYVAPESELEASFLELVRVHCLPDPERQVDLGDSDGWVGRVDFRFPGKVIVEVDGYKGHSQLLDGRADQARDRRLAAADWRVLRFGWTDVTVDDTRVAAQIREAIRAAA